MLEVKQLDVFIGRKQIIKGASFQVGDGEIVGLIGPNGAGKTTIMKTILALTKFKGQVLVNHQTVTSNHHQALLKVGALIEHPALYPYMTGRQNLALYAQSEVEIDELARALEMEAYIDARAKGYSLGMKQKLGIALALLNHPDLAILDEPMNGLDVEATILVRNLILRMAQKGTAFLISSHILSELERVVSNVVLINKGKILLTDSLKNFQSGNSRYYQITTDNLFASYELLESHGVVSELQKDYLKINAPDLQAAEKLLVENEQYLLTVAPEKLTFEQQVVKSLRSRQEVR
ncbi:ATP-binding cassette domain-containing protein [Pediococcus acidilactici]|uniref:ABC transporter ATP-binding protein n=1 Tax=Pediococcus acidilactici TaxID=1254 RepID=UPI00132570A3|nr:ATP-binding cassette domain-containing protein [Pediococcus acidilactici]KAF0336220.1 ATP-binding cassette domain-containing protein [Pediococcus acidilactici]KAF0338540.1 ATP-binding cassette domain-containing protein [Pediococcus acidilactici]KAF0341014.1 ATP-binding cassette domain-containing protein [Pediococcus acidilactici]KAF0346032.1 ATP-binding cassette domain-containing protein [Pediococcus acidilactici]KAF0350622.1 ATP-binding cassette domain-containing protein [Pediococcus acidi